MRKIQALPNNFNTLAILTRSATFPFHAEPRQPLIGRAGINNPPATDSDSVSELRPEVIAWPGPARRPAGDPSRVAPARPQGPDRSGPLPRSGAPLQAASSPSTLRGACAAPGYAHTLLAMAPTLPPRGQLRATRAGPAGPAAPPSRKGFPRHIVERYNGFDLVPVCGSNPSAHEPADYRTVATRERMLVR